jgi:hypothetical protein
MKALAVMLAVLAFVLLAFAHPFSITCAIDGEQMMFDHFQPDATHPMDGGACWYSHNTYYKGQYVHHEASMACKN